MKAPTNPYAEKGKHSHPRFLRPMKLSFTPEGEIKTFRCIKARELKTTREQNLRTKWRTTIDGNSKPYEEINTSIKLNAISVIKASAMVYNFIFCFL